MIKNKISNFFFLEYVKIFSITLLSLSLLIWMMQAARLLELVTEYGNPIKVYSIYMILNYPKIIDNIFLICFAISMFFLFNKLEESKEITIFWFSGIDKNTIVNLSLIIGIVCLIINLILSSYIAPLSSLIGRKVLASSSFTLINSLVKEQNFNNPLKGLTIYVEKNDNKGNLNNIFIYEKDRTIIANSGRVLVDKNEKNYLELLNGITQEKINNKINIINFKKTLFDYSKYKLRNTSVPKYSERDLKWLITNSNNTKNQKVNEIREEINKRIIKPFLILIITLLSCFLLISKNKKLKFYNNKILIYFTTFSLLIANESVLNLSGKNLNYSLYYFLLIITIFICLNFFLRKILNKM